MTLVPWVLEPISKILFAGTVFFNRKIIDSVLILCYIVHVIERSDNMEAVELFTDGACSGNPGPGGWCALLKAKGAQKLLSGAQKDTTNNRMELSAVINGLKALKRPCQVTVISDSKYVCDAINKNWLADWKKRNWKKSSGDAVLNPDLWEELDSLLQIHKVNFQWIKGHDGHPENELCDKTAVKEYKKLLSDQ